MRRKPNDGDRLLAMVRALADLKPDLPLEQHLADAKIALAAMDRRAAESGAPPARAETIERMLAPNSSPLKH